MVLKLAECEAFFVLFQLQVHRLVALMMLLHKLMTYFFAGLNEKLHCNVSCVKTSNQEIKGDIMHNFLFCTIFSYFALQHI
jgi:hypothetical protein